MSVYGGWSEVSLVSGLPAERVKELRGLLDQVREPAQVKAGRAFAALEPLDFATQVVAGQNYRIMAYTGDGYNGVFEIFKPLATSDKKTSLTSYKEESLTPKLTPTPTK